MNVEKLKHSMDDISSMMNVNILAQHQKRWAAKIHLNEF